MSTIDPGGQMLATVADLSQRRRRPTVASVLLGGEYRDVAARAIHELADLSDAMTELGIPEDEPGEPLGDRLRRWAAAR